MRKKKREEKKTKDKNYIPGLILRYSLVLLSAIGSFSIFYIIFTPLTFYPVLFILKFFYGAVGDFESLLVYANGFSIQIIGACVAGAAYFLLFALNLMTKGIKFRDRIKIMLFSFFSLLAVNIIRIIILSALLINSSGLFDTAHFIFWNFLSTIFVVLIWLLIVRIYRIKEIPLVSDAAYLAKWVRKR